MEKTLYQFTSVLFDPEPQDEEMKLIKVKNGFKVDEVEAKEIIKKIDSGKPFLISLDEKANPYSYGIRVIRERYEDIIRKEKEKKEEDRWVEEERLLEKAKVWLKTLPEEEQEMIRVLGYYHFRVVAVG